MNSNLSVFQNSQFGEIRIVTLEDNTPWIIAKDVCNTLGLKNVSQALANVDEDDKSSINPNIINYDIGISNVLNKKSFGKDVRTIIPEASNGGRDLLIINESGFYTLILRSNKPEAKAFKRWVTSEVLPTLRKTGVYEMPNPKPAPAPVAKTVFEPNYLSEKVQLLEKIVQLQEKLLAVPVQKAQRPKKAPLTSEEKATILQLWREGKGCTAIGKVVNRNDSSIRYQLKQMGA